MGLPPINNEATADLLEKSLDMFGIKDAFPVFRTTRKEWLFKAEHQVGSKEEWVQTNQGLLMPKLGIY